MSLGQSLSFRRERERNKEVLKCLRESAAGLHRSRKTGYKEAYEAMQAVEEGNVGPGAD